jgi:hypothetical protein
VTFEEAIESAHRHQENAIRGETSTDEELAQTIETTLLSLVHGPGDAAMKVTINAPLYHDIEHDISPPMRSAITLPLTVQDADLNVDQDLVLYLTCNAFSDDVPTDTIMSMVARRIEHALRPKRRNK